MVSPSFSILAGLMALASASPCKPPTYYLPSTGTGTDLPAPGSDVKLLHIAVGHGLQNYTCANDTASPVATGALAVLYDVTKYFPGTRSTGLSPDAFDALSGQVLWGQDLPLNLQTASAASPGTRAAPNALAERDYGAVVGDPFPSPAPGLSLPGVLADGAPFLGHHYFNDAGIPTFDLPAAGLFGNMKKTAALDAPATADPGILDSGAVAWLQLGTNPAGVARGIKMVYRVITVGGASEACSAVDSAEGSVPYAAFYWFFG